MSWNRIVLTLFIVFSFGTVASYAKELMKISEDELIIRALLYDEYKAYENSYQAYKKLYDDTYSFQTLRCEIFNKNGFMYEMSDKDDPQNLILFEHDSAYYTKYNS